MKQSKLETVDTLDIHGWNVLKKINIDVRIYIYEEKIGEEKRQGGFISPVYANQVMYIMYDV